MAKHQIKRTMGLALVLALALTASGCQKREVAPKVIVPPQETPVEEVFDKMAEEEAEVLLNQVREYAETFDIGTVDKALRVKIKEAVAKGESAEVAADAIWQISEPFMEAQLKAKIAEGLDEIVGRHTEEDVALVYEAMNMTDLVAFIVHYEIERLKMEGYLR